MGKRSNATALAAEVSNEDNDSVAPATDPLWNRRTTGSGTVFSCSNRRCWYFCQFDTVLLLAILLLPLHNFINRTRAVQVRHMAEQFESITGAFAKSKRQATSRLKMTISFSDPEHGRRASRPGLLSYNEVLLLECVQGPAMSKSENDSRHYPLSVRQGRLRIQEVRLCLQ